MDRSGDAARRETTTLRDTVFVITGPTLCGDRFTGEVDHRVGAADFRCPGTGGSVRRPRNGANLLARFIASPAGQDGDEVSGLCEGIDQRTAEKPGCAGDDNSHALFKHRSSQNYSCEVSANTIDDAGRDRKGVNAQMQRFARGWCGQSDGWTRQGVPSADRQPPFLMKVVPRSNFRTYHRNK